MKSKRPLKPFKGAVWSEGRWTGVPPKKKAPTGIRRVSSRKHKLDLIYSQRRKWFLAQEENQRCPVADAGLIPDSQGELEWHYRQTTQIHHKLGRVGVNYLDETGWMAVSAEGHSWIHANPSEARKRGWILSKNNSSSQKQENIPAHRK